MGDQNNEEDEDTSDSLSPLDHIFSALKNFAKASERPARSGSAASRAGATALAGAFGAPVKKSCCLARRNAGSSSK